jgi:hypothetical protein
MSKQAWVTLHLPPPLTFTLESTLLLFSTMVTLRLGFSRAAFTAQKKPAAPPPITIKCCCFIYEELYYCRPACRQAGWRLQIADLCEEPSCCRFTVTDFTFVEERAECTSTIYIIICAPKTTNFKNTLKPIRRST